MSQLVSQYRRRQEPEILKELRDSVSTLAALIDEVDQRNW